METSSEKSVVVELFKSVPGMKSCHVLGSKTGLDTLLKAGDKAVTFLWIDGRLEDPIFDFWKVHRANVLAHDCHVIFTDIKRDTGWADLERCFGGTRFGTLFLMRVSENARPSVVPSQRGMYIK